MRVQALKSFAGAISMYEGEVREVTSLIELNDLLAAGYIKEIEPKKDIVQKPVETPKPTPKKRVEKRKKK